MGGRTIVCASTEFRFVDATGISHALCILPCAPQTSIASLPFRTEPFDRESRHFLKKQHALSLFHAFRPCVVWQVFLPGELEVKEQESRCKQEDKEKSILVGICNSANPFEIV